MPAKPTQREYDRELAAIRRRTLALQQAAVDAFRQAAARLAKMIAHDVRYLYDQERAVASLANAAVMMKNMKDAAAKDVDEVWISVAQALWQEFQKAARWSTEEIDQMLTTLGERTAISKGAGQQALIAAQFSADLIQGLKAGVLQDVNTRLQLGVLGGKSPTAIITDLEQVLPTRGTRFESMERGALIRAEAVVRTELARIHSQGQEMRAEEYQAEGIDVIKVWHHSPGSQYPRAGHMRMDGQEVKFTEKFVNPITGNKLRYPQDPRAEAEETVNCGCWMNVTTARFRKNFERAA